MKQKHKTYKQALSEVITRLGREDWEMAERVDIDSFAADVIQVSADWLNGGPVYTVDDTLAFWTAFEKHDHWRD